MKLIIPNRDVNDPADTRVVTEVALELDVGVAPISPDLSAAIEKAAAANAVQLSKEEKKQKRREAQARAEAGIRELAASIKEDTGVSIGFKKPWAFEAKPKAAYELWKRVVPMFVERPETLEIGPTALAEMLAASEPNYTINRDMMYDRLNEFAEADAERLLHKLGVPLKLQRPVTIRSIQKQLIARRDAAASIPTEEFSGRFVIQGKTAYVNGKPYAIQLNSSGHRRIKLRPCLWLPLDTLKEFCLRSD